MVRESMTWMCAGLLLAGAPVARAGADRAGTTAANFLVVGSGARALGMGGVALGLNDGLGSATWNAGSLGFLDRTEFTLSHAALSGETGQEWAAMGGRFGRSAMRWSLSGLYQSEGSFEARDASNNSTGSFSVSSMALGGSLAGSVGSHAAFGFGAKWVTDNLGTYVRGSGITFDAGLQARSGMLSFGASAQNVGGQMRYGVARYPFPTSYGLGVGIEHPATGLRVGLDLNVPSAYYKDVRGGLEWRFKDRFALRGGYRLELGAPADEPLTGPAFGAGAGVSGVWLDYGYLIRGTGDGEHRIALCLRPGGLKFGDPFGQKNIPREFGPEPAPKKKS